MEPTTKVNKQSAIFAKNNADMKKVLIGTLLVLAAALLVSCEKDGPGSKVKVTFRKANIAGAKMLAIAQGTAATKAEGNIAIGPKALYTVSEDGTMVQVTYNVDVEGVDGDVAETIKADLILSPGFIFPVGEVWLWLANFLYAVDDWEHYPKGAARSAMSRIMNNFSAIYNERHGAHFLIRKSDGAIFEWTIEAGAPDGMDDGFKQPNFLNGWFHQLGKDLYVKTWGWLYDAGATPSGPSLYRLVDKGSTLDAVNLLGDNIGCSGIYPAENCLGVHFQYDGAWPLGIIAPPSFEPILLSLDPNSKDYFLLSIAGKLYVGISVREEVDGSRIVDKTDFYNLDINGNSVTLGSKICTYDGWADGNGRAMVSSGETLSWWSGNGMDGSIIITLDPKAGTIHERFLPEHYPDLQSEYVNGVGYTVDGTAGFWECDLSKDAAEYVALDWSSAAEYQSKIVPGTLKMERFEAASLTLQFKASLTNGTQLNFYASVVGDDRGKIKTTIGSENNAGMVVTTMVRLN